MFIRIYFEGHCKDIVLQKHSRFTIGSGSDDDLIISHPALPAHYIAIENNFGRYELFRNGKAELLMHPSQHYALSEACKLALLAVNDYAENGVNVALTKPQTRIGRGTDNDIVLPDSLVSCFHATIYNIACGFVLTDQGSTNGTYVNGDLVQERKLCNGDEIIIGDCKLCYCSGNLTVYGKICNNLQKDGERKTTPPQSDKILFKRSPRLKLDVPTGEIVIQSPPNIGAKPEISWLSVLLPSLATVGVSVAVTLIMGMNKSMLTFTAPMSLIGVTVSVINYVRQTKKHASREALRTETYTRHLDDVTEQIEEKQNEQKEALLSANPDVSKCLEIAASVNRRLWERKPSDNDFMSVRIGSGDVAFSMNIRAPQKALSLTEDDLLNRAIEMSEKYRIIKNLPITFSVAENCSCGIVGNRDGSFRLLSNILLNLATLHCYTEVKFILLLDEKTCGSMEWAFSLPHCYDNERQFSYIAKNKQEAEKLLREFESLFKERLRDVSENHVSAKLQLPYCLFVITDPMLIKGETFDRFLYGNSSELGLGCIFLYDSVNSLPKECNIIIETTDTDGVIYNKDNASDKTSFRLDTCPNDTYRKFGEAVKNIFCDDLSTEATIAKSITLYALLKIQSAEELDIGADWSRSDIVKSMAAPLGVKEKDEIVYLDLRESAHGPHGLVAGTTGSGKSEILQTYILSMAVLYPPYEVGFVIIDFKGGGMANQFEGLPHLIGTITDMDGKEINRSQMSVKAELDKRKRIFIENRVQSINDYIELYKSGKATVPLPHLIIIVDEFAELKADRPEFMSELISASRIGRSLGVHLILATQKPAGQVNEQIWSNSKFKLCLKVQDKNDSQEVIKSPLAAKIKEPGRAYLKLGDSDAPVLFQSGYSGAKITLPDGTVSTQLKEIVKHIKKYCVDNNIKPLLPICLPPLPAKINFDEAIAAKKRNDAKIPIGIYDLPAAQAQGAALINSDQNTFILGAAQTGKTNLLQCIIRALSSAYSPNEVSIYIIDFASTSLKIFETLNHVGGVVTREEDEKLKNLFKLLINEIEKRKKRTVDVGVSSFKAYLQAGFTDMERIVVLLDDFVAYKELYGEEYDEVFAKICKEGITYGISVIVTCTQTSGFGYKFLSLFAGRIAFTSNDSSDYSDLFGGYKFQLSDIAGRALYKDFDCVPEMQTYLAFQGDIEKERTESMKQYIAVTNEKYTGMYAKKIPCVPDKLTLSYIKQNIETAAHPYEYVIGLDYADVSAATLDFNVIGELTVVGKSPEQKRSVIGTLIDIFRVNAMEEPVKIHIMDSILHPLKKLADCPLVARYTVDCNETDTILDEIDKAVTERYSLLVGDKYDELDKLPLILVIINNNDIIDYISSSKDLSERYKKISKQMKALKVAFIYSDICDENVPYGAPEILKKLKESKNAVITDNLQDVQFFDISPSIARSHKRLRSGDVFFMTDGKIKRIKMAEGE